MSDISHTEDIDMSSILSLLNEEKSTDITRYEKPTQNVEYNNRKLENAASHERSILNKPDGDKTKRVSFDLDTPFKCEEKKNDKDLNNGVDDVHEKVNNIHIERDARNIDENIRNDTFKPNKVETTPTFDIDELLNIANGSNDISNSTYERGLRCNESIDKFQNFHVIKSEESVVRQSNQSREMDQLNHIPQR